MVTHPDIQIYPFFKSLTVLRKTVQTVLDPRLVVLKSSEFLLLTCYPNLCMLYSRTFKKNRHISKWTEFENCNWTVSFKATFCKEELWNGNRVVFNLHVCFFGVQLQVYPLTNASPFFYFFGAMNFLYCCLYWFVKIAKKWLLRQTSKLWVFVIIWSLSCSFAHKHNLKKI